MDSWRFGTFVAAILLAVSCSSTSSGGAAPDPTDVGGTPSDKNVVTVPPLANEPLVLAERELRRLGLRVETTKPRDVHDCPVDGRCVSGAALFVSAQEPHAGARVPKNSVVALDIVRYVRDRS